MTDQADKLRSLVGRGAGAVERAGGGLPMVVVSGARAGVGATTVALNLAAVLADRTGRVLLVDAAPVRQEVCEALASRRDVEFGLCDVLAGKCGIEDAIVTGAGGLQMLLQRWMPRTVPDQSRQGYERLMGALQSLRQRFDLIVVDAGRGYTGWTQRFWSHSKLIVLVSTTDDESVLDAYSAIKQSASSGDQLPVRLLVNLAESNTEADRAQRRIDKSCQRFLSRGIPALPALVRHAADAAGTQKPPRVWEAPNTPFGHAALWLGRAVGELVTQQTIELPRGSGARIAEFQRRASA